MRASIAGMPAVLTVEEAAEVLRIGRTAAYQAVRAGEIPSLRLGRKIRIPRAALLQLLGEPGHQPDSSTGELFE